MGEDDATVMTVIQSDWRADAPIKLFVHQRQFCKESPTVQRSPFITSLTLHSTSHFNKITEIMICYSTLSQSVDDATIAEALMSSAAEAVRTLMSSAAEAVRTLMSSAAKAVENL